MRAVVSHIDFTLPGPPWADGYEVEVRIQLETRGVEHAEQMLTRLREKGYRVVE